VEAAKGRVLGPAAGGFDRVGGGRALGFVHLDCSPAQLELRVGIRSVGDRRLEHHTRVASDIVGLPAAAIITNISWPATRCTSIGLIRGAPSGRSVPSRTKSWRTSTPRAFTASAGAAVSSSAHRTHA
jgi:hypothetical protein